MVHGTFIGHFDIFLLKTSESRSVWLNFKETFLTTYGMKILPHVRPLKLEAADAAVSLCGEADL